MALKVRDGGVKLPRESAAGERLRILGNPGRIPPATRNVPKDLKARRVGRSPVSPKVDEPQVTVPPPSSQAPSASSPSLFHEQLGLVVPMTADGQFQIDGFLFHVQAGLVFEGNDIVGTVDSQNRFDITTKHQVTLIELDLPVEKIEYNHFTGQLSGTISSADIFGDEFMP